MSTITEIQNWFQEQCDDDWEHSYGIKIETCDNPGWSVRIDIIGTALENKSFETISKNIPPTLMDQALGLIKEPYICAEPNFSDDWLMCYIKNQEFNGAGDPKKLEEILRIFLNWAKAD